MKTAIGLWIRCALASVLLLGAAETALAGQHTWDVNEVFSNADGTIQFVELLEANGTAGEVNIHTVTLSAAVTGESFVIGGSALTPPTSNKHFLLGTAAFAALPGAPTPDRIIPAGSVPFFSTSGDTVSYYSYDSWNFGTVPTNGVDSLNRTGSPAIRPSSPTNYAGESGGAPVPALDGLGIGLVVGLLVLGGIAFALRSRAKVA
jgi:hypothetical protein